jgi:hypothetical protein
MHIHMLARMLGTSESYADVLILCRVRIICSAFILFTELLPDRLKTRYASKVKWLSLHTTFLHAPDTPVDETPPTPRAVYNMLRPLASLMRHITTNIHHHTIHIHNTLMNSR